MWRCLEDSEAFWRPCPLDYLEIHFRILFVVTFLQSFIKIAHFCYVLLIAFTKLKPRERPKPQSLWLIFHRHHLSAILVVSLFLVFLKAEQKETFFIIARKCHHFAHVVQYLSNSRTLFGYAVGKKNNSVSCNGAGKLNFGKKGVRALCVSRLLRLCLNHRCFV